MFLLSSVACNRGQDGIFSFKADTFSFELLDQCGTISLFPSKALDLDVILKFLLICFCFCWNDSLAEDEIDIFTVHTMSDVVVLSNVHCAYVIPSYKVAVSIVYCRFVAVKG